MKKVFALVFINILFFCCKNSNNENKPLTATDFLKFYKPLNLPASIADSGLTGIGDTSTITSAVFTHFIPDSAVEQILSSKISKYIIHPAGIIHLKTTDYLVTKFVSDKIIKLVVFVLDNKHQYKTALLLLDNHNIDKYHYSVSITNEPAFIIRKEKTGNDNELLYSRNGYSFNATTNSFAEVMNDSNEDKLSAVINPVDTFARLNKLSGDYTTDKKNFISVRDGKNLNTYIFFIHFEKNNGTCIGELKGEMNLTDENNAIYQESGDPCVIHFKFSNAALKVKEEGNCGNYRGITCPFDFTFKKQKNKKANSHSPA